MKIDKNRSLLFISATHGDEGFSIPILDKLEKIYPREKFGYDRIIGNPNALKINERQTEGNLNRLAPGNLKSKTYEKRRAYEIMQIAKKFDYVIDIHGARSECGIVIIMCKPSLPNFILAGMLNVKKIVVWTTKEDLKTGPLTQFCKTGLEIECGKKTDKLIQQSLKAKLKKFITTYQKISINQIMNNLREKEIFVVYDKLIGKDKNLKDFVVVRKQGEQFYPFMSNLYPGVGCYKMRKINFEDLFLSRSKI